MKIETMTVRELKALLSRYPDETKVAFAFPAHDYLRTTLAGAIQKAEFANVEFTSYHDTHSVVEGERDELDEYEQVLILS